MNDEARSFRAMTVGVILAVNDSPAGLSHAVAAVTQLGHWVHTVPDPQAALTALAERDFDLILLDIVLPSRSGFDLIGALKRDERLRHVPIVVVSCAPEQTDRVVEAIEHGADDFLPKSLDLFVLRARIDACLHRKRRRDLELDYLHRVHRLIAAAENVEAGIFHSVRTDLREVVLRADGLGRLAESFVSLAEKVHEREKLTLETIASLDRAYHLWGLALVMLAAALWATVGVASRLVPHEVAVPEAVYAFGRTVVAGPALLLIALISMGPAGLRPRKGSMRKFWVFGICCAVFQISLFRCFSLLGVTITVFLTVCLPPVLAMAWALLRGSERFSPHVLSALAMATVGVVAFGGDDVGNGEASGVVVGLILSLVASAAFVAMSHAARTLSADHAPMLVSGLGLVLAALILAPVTLLLTPIDSSQLSASLTDWRSLGILLYLGLGPTALAYLSYCSGMARCRSAVVGLIASMIEPGVAAGLAILFLREVLSAWEVMGCVLLSFAMLTLWLEENQTRRGAAEARSGP